MQIKNTVQEHAYLFPYENRQIEYTVWSTKSHGGGYHTILFLGTVQIEKLPKWVAEICPDGTLIVQGAPHWFAAKDGSDIPKFMKNFTKLVFETLQNHFRINPLHIIAESQGVPGVLALLTNVKYNQFVQQLTLVQPLGLNSSAYGTTNKQRIAMFKKRILTNARYQLKPLLTDSRLRYNHQLANKMTGADNPVAHAQYNSGLSYDAVADLLQVVKVSIPITIICGGRDALFPAHEIEQNLKSHGINVPIRVVPKIPHSPLATKYGSLLLSAALPAIIAHKP